MIAALTITCNRLDLTKQMYESFRSKTKVHYHLFVDNGSEDGTKEWLKDKAHILLDKNYGISYAMTVGIRILSDFAYILKLDNDIEILTDKLVEKIMDFYFLNGGAYIVSPNDITIDSNFIPRLIGAEERNGLMLRFTSHTGGAFQVIPKEIARKYATEDFQAKGDLERGLYFQRNGWRPVYIDNYEIRHIGLDKSVEDYQL